MIVQSPPINYPDRPLENVIPPVRGSDNILVQAILASGFDGVLILTEQGKWIQANQAARRICDRLSPGSPASGQTPDAIWQVCQALIQSRSSHPQALIIAESELRISASDCFRIRARWFKFGANLHPHMLVILEDRGQALQSQAIAEVDQYGLTPREAEVWLLHRTHYTYKKIALELYISIHTVKKHMKNIRTKQQLAQVMEDYRTGGALALN
ncbi:MAG: helix-turn-helix transcriptional regulator [Pseudanabaenales cyanobacterium]|nr:helix-turn-helix transcriptional regulator [Pseudanabaenales cyanobacterium]